MPAATASYCAGQQDPQLFWDMHEWLFANQATWSEAADAADQFRKQALALGADGAKYDACLSDPATEARIQRDIQDGMSSGVQGTPAFLINDWFLSGAYPFAEFQKIIEKAKQGLHPAPTPTPLPQGVDFFEVDPNRAGLTYDGSPSLGKADAGLVLLSFEDYKNAGAAQHATSVEPALKTKYVDTGEMRLVVKPLADTAPGAAVAAVCAARQGKFWEFRTLLYEKQAEWQEGDDAAMSGYAKSLGLDQAAFDACLKDVTAQNEVDYATAFAQEIGVPTVPSFLVLKIGADGKPENSQGLPGAQTLEQIEQAINALQAPPPRLPPWRSRRRSWPASRWAWMPTGTSIVGTRTRRSSWSISRTSSDRTAPGTLCKRARFWMKHTQSPVRSSTCSATSRWTFTRMPCRRRRPPTVPVSRIPSYSGICTTGCFRRRTPGPAPKTRLTSSASRPSRSAPTAPSTMPVSPTPRRTLRSSAT